MVAFQDFKSRTVLVFYFPLLIILFCLEQRNKLTLTQSGTNIIECMLFLLIELITLSLYFIIYYRGRDKLRSSIGIGDVFFMSCLCFTFSPGNYIVFYLISLILTCLGYLLICYFFKINSSTVPLAGAQALILLCCYLIKSFFVPMDFYSDKFICSFLV